MRQIGALDIIHSKWDRLSMLQSEKGSFSLAEASPLHGRQAGLVFFIFAFAGVTSLVILILECVAVKLMKTIEESRRTNAGISEKLK